MLKINDELLNGINGGISQEDYLYVMQNYQALESPKTVLSDADINNLFLVIKKQGRTYSDWFLGMFEGVDVNGNYQFDIQYGMLKISVINPAGYTFTKTQKL